jgi:hypothetical protein
VAGRLGSDCRVAARKTTGLGDRELSGARAVPSYRSRFAASARISLLSASAPRCAETEHAGRPGASRLLASARVGAELSGAWSLLPLSRRLGSLGPESCFGSRPRQRSSQAAGPPAPDQVPVLRGRSTQCWRSFVAHTIMSRPTGREDLHDETVQSWRLIMGAYRQSCPASSAAGPPADRVGLARDRPWPWASSYPAARRWRPEMPTLREGAPGGV